MFEIVPDASPLLEATARSLLAVHIAGGATAIASGWIAVAAKKGGRAHAIGGTTFLISMLAMCASAAAIVPTQVTPAWGNGMMGLFTAYLVTSGWATARARPGQPDGLQWLAVGLGGIAAGLGLLLTLADAAGLLRGDPQAPWLLGGLAGLLAALDVRRLRAGGWSGSARTRRHIWRMCFGFAAANGAFFLGQPQHMPEFVTSSGLNLVPPLGALAVLGVHMFKHRGRLPRLGKAVPAIS